MENTIKISDLNKEEYKRYLEVYARLSLEMAYDISYGQLDKKESPDWQSDTLGIGLEVTQGIDTHEGRTNAIVQRYFGRGLDGDYIVQEVKKHFPKFKGNIESVDGAAILSNSKGLYDFSMHIDNVQNSYIDKIKKLNRNYKVFKSNQLYIFTFQCMILEGDIIKFLNCIDNKFKLQFDVCFINCIDVLYVCDIMEKSIMNTINFDDDLLRMLKSSALAKCTGE